MSSRARRASPPLAGLRRHSAEIRWEGGISKQPGWHQQNSPVKLGQSRRFGLGVSPVPSVSVTVGIADIKTRSTQRLQADTQTAHSPHSLLDVCGFKHSAHMRKSVGRSNTQHYQRTSPLL
ncbi:hypothetical protein Bbelb_017000 [Branchiostoma belcheri]|nr:hypothetical protein Bbelb_017000 [Branchiostoma belcheri]